MPSPVVPEFTSHVLEHMAGLRGVDAKKMFGGYGIFRMGLMFALILNDELYFKVDDTNLDRFKTRGLKAFTYEAKGKIYSLRYYQAPPEVFDDPQAMLNWSSESYACALRSQKGKAPKSKRKVLVSGKIKPTI